jgi:hypothetical protein
MLTPAGTVKVTDFSHSKGKILLRLSRTGVFVGTYAYASPEQVGIRTAVGPATDIWSLGATIYELVTLSVPFPGKNVDEVCAKIQEARPVPPRKLNPKIPGDLERIVLRCLKRDPELRYPSAAELAEDLDRVAAGEAPSIAPIGMCRRLRFALRRPTRRVVAVILALAAVALTLGVVMTVDRLQVKAERRRLVEDRARLAHELIDRGVRTRRSDHFQRAIQAAVAALRADPDDRAGQQLALAIPGLFASEQGDAVVAFRLLTEAHRLGPLPLRTHLALARSALALGRLEEAQAHYASLPAGEGPAAIEGEIRLVQAYAQATALEGTVFRKCLDAEPLGLPAGSVLTLVQGQWRHGGAIHLFPAGLHGAARVLWPIPVDPGIDAEIGPDPGSQSWTVSDIAIADIDGDGQREVLAYGYRSLHIARGPFLLGEAPPQEHWSSLGNPIGQTLDRACWADTHGPVRKLESLAILGSDDPQTRQIVVSRNCGFASLIPTAGGWRASGEACRELAKGTLPSDVYLLRAACVDGEPSVLLGLGPWNHFSFHLMKPGPRGHLVPVASTRLGTPMDALVVRPPGFTRDVVLVGIAGHETYMHRQLFGGRSPHGWEFGVHILEVDPATRSFVPAGSLRLPRPIGGGIGLALADLVGGPGEEVLISLSLDGVDGAAPLLRTIVATWTDSGRALRETGIRLPGWILAVLSATDGGLDLVVQWSSAETRIVRLRR